MILLINYTDTIFVFDLGSKLFQAKGKGLFDDKKSKLQLSKRMDRINRMKVIISSAMMKKQAGAELGQAQLKLELSFT